MSQNIWYEINSSAQMINPKSLFWNKFIIIFFFLGLLPAGTKQVSKAEELKIHVVTQAVLNNDVKTQGIISQIEKHSLTEWGSDVRINTYYII